MPDWSHIHKELRRPGVTLLLLWQEYKLQYPEGYQYSWFSDQYRQWRSALDVVMRQHHVAGEKLFVDYAGQTAPVVNQHSGEIRQAQIFVATLGASSYTYAEATWSQSEWKEARVHMDYHVEVDKHYYSVPYQLVKKQLSVRMASQTIECFHKGQRVASHRRSHQKGGHTTQPGHMPEKHRRYAEWTPERLQKWALKTGPETAAVVSRLMVGRKYPEQAFRSCLGVLRLGKSFGEERLENACRRALYMEACYPVHSFGLAGKQ